MHISWGAPIIKSVLKGGKWHMTPLNAQLQRKLITIVRHELSLHLPQENSQPTINFTQNTKGGAFMQKQSLQSKMKMISYHEQLMHYVHSSLRWVMDKINSMQKQMQWWLHILQANGQHTNPTTPACCVSAMMLTVLATPLTLFGLKRQPWAKCRGHQHCSYSQDCYGGRKGKHYIYRAGTAEHF